MEINYLSVHILLLWLINHNLLAIRPISFHNNTMPIYSLITNCIVSKYCVLLLLCLLTDSNKELLIASFFSSLFFISFEKRIFSRYLYPSSNLLPTNEWKGYTISTFVHSLTLPFYRARYQLAKKSKGLFSNPPYSQTNSICLSMCFVQ